MVKSDIYLVACLDVFQLSVADVVAKLSHDNGTTWGTLRVVHSESTENASVAIGNPTLKA